MVNEALGRVKMSDKKRTCAQKTIPALRQSDKLDPITDEMDNTMLRLLYTFRARHIETVIGHFSAQLRDLGALLQLRANSKLTQFHHALLEQSAYEVRLRDALIKSLMFLNSTPLMDVDTIERMEVRFLEAFALVGGESCSLETDSTDGRL